MSRVVSQTKRGIRIRLTGKDASDFMKLLCVPADERAALQKFNAQAEDDIHIPVEMMERMFERGLVERAPGNWYRVSSLGCKLIAGEPTPQQAVQS